MIIINPYRFAVATNLILQPNAYNNSPWGLGNVTVTSDATAASSGLTTADKVVASGGVDIHYLYQYVAKATSAFTYKLSMDVKSAELTNFKISVQDGPGSSGIERFFNLNTGALGSGGSSGTFSLLDSSIVAIDNGFYKVSVIFLSNSDNNLSVYPQLVNPSETIYFSGAGTNGLYLSEVLLIRV